MNLRRLLDLVVATPASGWYDVPHSEKALMPYLSIGTWTGPTHEWGVEVHGHHSLAVHLESPELSIAWGLPLEDDLKTEQFRFPHEGVSSVAADVLRNGVLIHRESLLLVDGGRSYLPHQSALSIDSEPTTSDRVGETVTEWQHKFAGLLDSLERTSQYERYFGMSGFVVVPGHPLDRDEGRE